MPRRRGRRRRHRSKQQPEPLPPLGALLRRDGFVFHSPLKRLGGGVCVRVVAPSFTAALAVAPLTLLATVFRRVDRRGVVRVQAQHLILIQIVKQYRPRQFKLFPFRQRAEQLIRLWPHAREPYVQRA